VGWDRGGEVVAESGKKGEKRKKKKPLTYKEKIGKFPGRVFERWIPAKKTRGGGPAEKGTADHRRFFRERQWGKGGGGLMGGKKESFFQRRREGVFFTGCSEGDPGNYDRG